MSNVPVDGAYGDLEATYILTVFIVISEQRTFDSVYSDRGVINVPVDSVYSDRGVMNVPVDSVYSDRGATYLLTGTADSDPSNQWTGRRCC